MVLGGDIWELRDLRFLTHPNILGLVLARIFLLVMATELDYEALGIENRAAPQIISERGRRRFRKISS